jgi:hypothetical protein
VKFPANGSTANVRIFLNDKRPQSRFGKKGSIGQTVMTCTNNDRVVVVHRPVLFRIIVGIVLRQR